MNNERILIDTSAWIKYLRGMDDRLKERVAALVLEGRAYTSEMIILEILRGAKSDREYAMLSEDFHALPQLDTDRAVWNAAWELAYKLRKKGATVPVADTLIAAAALHHQCTLLHADSHYEIIAGFTALRIEKA